MKIRTRRAWTAAHDAQLRELFAGGRSLREIGVALGRCWGSVRVRLVALNIYGEPRRVRKVPPEERFAQLMRGRLFSIRVTNDWGGRIPPRPEAYVCSASSMSYAESREQIR